MRGYRIVLHTPTYHNDQFIGNIPTYLTIHAETETGARAKITLKPATKHRVDDKLTITQDQQEIYSVRLLGRVVTRVVTEYEPEGY